MPKDKSSGKKLADMMYGNPEGAAFGVFPQMKGKRSRQNPEAAKNFPVDLARGVIAGAVGMPGDIESLARLPYELITGNESPTILPTSEDVLKRIPFGSDTPASQFASGLGTLAGGSANIGAAPRMVKKGALAAGRAGERMAEKVVPGIMERGGAGADILSGLAQGSRSQVIKPKGGNWLGGSVEKAVEPLKVRGLTQAQADEMAARPTPIMMAREGVLSKNDEALNNWIDRNLTNYIKKEMATPEDPVRKLAEEGILHFQPQDVYLSPDTAFTRTEAGYPRRGMSKSQLAIDWEALSDKPIGSGTAGEMLNIGKGEPWMEKVDPLTRVHGIAPMDQLNMSRDLGFDHILDVLRQDLAEGRIRPEQLSKVSMEQAVRRTYEYDQEMAKKMREAQIKATEGMPVYKEYPEGFRWVELAVPNKLPEKFSVSEQNGGFNIVDAATGNPLLLGRGQTLTSFKTPEEAVSAYYRQNPKVLEDALKYEGETMGHCVGGYCPDVIEGRSRIFSLRDAKGEPHVTVEVVPQQPQRFYDLPEDVRDEISDAAYDALRAVDDPKIWNPDGSRSYYGDEKLQSIQENLMRDWLKQNAGSLPQEIVQIKGKQNRAPKDEYLPFVQDFVKSGQWSDVGDLRNTGLRDINSTPALKKYLEENNIAFDRFVPEETYKGFEDDFLMDRLYPRDDPRYAPPQDGMAHGGRVHISDNPDVMALELAGGGLVRGLKAAAKAAKAGADAPKPIVEAPSIIIPGTISRVKEAVRESKGDYGAKRIERAADEIRNLEKLYKEQALRDAFGGDNAKALMTMNPADFEKYAAPLNPRFLDESSTRYTTTGERLSYPEYMENYLPNVGAFNDVPFLEINKKAQGTSTPPFISGHEGRHRSRVMTNRGDQAGLVRLLPRAELREPLPRRSQEEYIEALREELNLSDRLVRPESEGSDDDLHLIRSLIELPDIYAKGGEVSMAAGGFARALKATAKAVKGTQDVLPEAEREANKAKFLEGSKTPMRLYHGTTATEGGKGTEAIRRIKPSKEGSLGSGVYLTPSSAHASGYSGVPNDEALEMMLSSPYQSDTALQLMNKRNAGEMLPGQEGGNMLPVYAQLRNPLIIEGKGDPMVQALVKLGMDEESASKMVERAYEQKGYIGKQVQQRAQAAGYDGLMQFRDGELSEVVSYNPNAVKSAIGNRGTYDINDPDLNKADGGEVSMAAGGISKLARLARAPAKSKQEIQAIAERIAPQVTGEYVRKDAKTAKTVAGKTQKQFQREKTLPVDVRPTAEERIPEVVDIEKLKGDVMIGVPGDPTLTGKTLYGVGDFTLGSPSPQHGGPLYGLYSDDAFWASGIGPARGVQNLAKRASKQYDAPVKGSYIMMGPDSINYAQHFADANLQAIDLSRMTKAQIEQFNELIRKGSKKSGPRDSFPGIEDKDSAYLHMAMDPELRKHFNALMQMPTVTEPLNLPSGTDIRFAITEPALRDLETGVTGFSMGRMRPDIPSKDLPLSTHPTYSHDIPGEFLGQSRFPVPYELSFPDTLQSIRANPKQARQEFGSLKMVGPRQIIDQQMIDEIKTYNEYMKRLTGKKKGGAVRKAAGGEITADDLILEERKL